MVDESRKVLDRKYIDKDPEGHRRRMRRNKMRVRYEGRIDWAIKDTIEKLELLRDIKREIKSGIKPKPGPKPRIRQPEP